jgi:voltage-gated potassium channel
MYNTMNELETLSPEQQDLSKERDALLQQLEDWLETPMLVLGFVWLALLVIELIWGLSPLLEGVGTVIWIVFVIDFGIKFTLAPRKIGYLKDNWITAVALLLPALRVFRIVRVFRVLRAARAARGLRLVRVLSSLNRGMRALGNTMGRRGFGYIVALTLVVTLAGAAGIFAFESDNPSGPRLSSYGAALWWTAMLMTTLGSDYWPQSPEGRILCFLLALYAFTIFGYVTATLATFFLDRDAENAEAQVAGQGSIALLHEEIQALRFEVRELARATNRNSNPQPDSINLDSTTLDSTVERG